MAEHRRAMIFGIAVGVVAIANACIGSDAANTSPPTPDAGGVDGASGSDADLPADSGAPTDGGGDAPTARCDVTKAFAAPRALDDINVPGTTNEMGRLTQDEKTLYFSRDGSDAGPGNYDVFVATRSGAGAKFSQGLPLNGGNTAGYDRAPSITADGLFVYAHGPGPGGSDVVVASRATTSASFAAFTALNGIATAEDEGNAYVLPNQSALYFNATRGGTSTIYRASHLGGGVFGTPQVVQGLASVANPGHAAVTTDERTMYINGGNTSTEYDVYVARRPSTSSAFDAPKRVPELSTPEADYPTWVSDDDCVILLTHRRPGGTYEILIAERPK